MTTLFEIVLGVDGDDSGLVRLGWGREVVFRLGFWGWNWLLT